MVNTAQIFDIQRYSIHDGPGIRTVVFFKGCPLRCQWCANPESWTLKTQLYYIKSRCIHCGCCVKAAPDGLVSMNKDTSLSIQFDKLNTLDFSWIRCCPTGAMGLKGQSMTVDEVFSILMRDEMFYRKSAGGVTLSGGDPLLQLKFTQELLRKLCEATIPTAVETEGFVPYEVLESVMPYVSLFLFDLKHLDPTIHQKYTGQSNQLILENLRKLAKKGTNIMVRTPIIPHVNDSVEHIAHILKFLKEIGITKYALLPFHQYGKGKYCSLGYKYSLDKLQAPSDGDIAVLRELIRSQGLSQDYEIQL